VAARLAPYRPAGIEQLYDGNPRCGRTPVEALGGVMITWTSDRRSDQLGVTRGCSNAEAVRLLRDLEAIGALLPIADLIGPQP